ncbi:hypothetical protein HDU96_010137 [Phlyctochytrium bullatum]|nr:hypothetical protein HDU96_010137 [Phlyctochytrium bullatum]
MPHHCHPTDASSSPSSDPHCPGLVTALPADVLSSIVLHLHPNDLISLRATSRECRSLWLNNFRPSLSFAMLHLRRIGVVPHPDVEARLSYAEINLAKTLEQPQGREEAKNDDHGTQPDQKSSWDFLPSIFRSNTSIGAGKAVKKQKLLTPKFPHLATILTINFDALEDSYAVAALHTHGLSFCLQIKLFGATPGKDLRRRKRFAEVATDAFNSCSSATHRMSPPPLAFPSALDPFAHNPTEYTECYFPFFLAGSINSMDLAATLLAFVDSIPSPPAAGQPPLPRCRRRRVTGVCRDCSDLPIERVAIESLVLGATSTGAPEVLLMALARLERLESTNPESESKDREGSRRATPCPHSSTCGLLFHAIKGDDGTGRSVGLLMDWFLGVPISACGFLETDAIERGTELGVGVRRSWSAEDASWKNALQIWIVYGLHAGGTITGFKLRGRKWNYSPVTDGEFCTGDFVHIRGSCSEDDAYLQVHTNFTTEYWYKFEPEEMWNNVNVPHPFAMGPEYNFWQTFLVMDARGNLTWASNWVSPCGWINILYDPNNINPFVWKHPSTNKSYISNPPHTWLHFSVISDNYNVTTYLNGYAVGNMYCPRQFKDPPVWAIGIRDWATDTKKVNQLLPIFPFSGEVAEFRHWNRAMTPAEVRSRMHRTLNSTELQDPALMFYFDFNNIHENYIIHDMSPTKRFKGYLGGTLGLEIDRPLLVPSSVPVVNISSSVIHVTMKESSEYPSTVAIPLHAVDNSSPAFTLLTTNVVYSLTSFPNPNIISLTLARPDIALLALSPALRLPYTLGTNFTLHATHKANASVGMWQPERFNLTVRYGSEERNVTVLITVLKNAKPIIGDSGGTIAPYSEPPSWTTSPISIPNFAWREAAYNWSITWEWVSFWTVGDQDDSRVLYAPQINYPSLGRINVEIHKNLVMDYGFDPDGSGRTSFPFRKKYGLWNHVAMVSAGKDAWQRMYINGELVTESKGNIAMRPNEREWLPFNATGFMVTPLNGNIVVDELRIWNTTRTQEEIATNMRRRLTGREPNLYLYHSFDSFDTRPDGTLAFRDQGPNGFDVICQGFQGPTSRCPFYRSQAPIGGQFQDIIFENGKNVSYWDPLGVDPDDDTAYLRFVVDVLPRDAQLFADRNVTLRSLDGDLRKSMATPTYVVPVTAGARIRKMQIIPAVMVVPTPDGGGNPYDSFTYHVTDGLADSAQATIRIFRKCWPGTFLDQSQRRCLPCPPGTFSATYSYSPTCQACPPGSAQPDFGATACRPCEKALFISIALNATLPANITFASNLSASPLNTFAYASAALPAFSLGLDDIASFGTHQPDPGQPSCLPCLQLTYSLRANATACEGKALIPRFLSVIPQPPAPAPAPAIPGMTPNPYNPAPLRSVLLPDVRPLEVEEALLAARLTATPRAVGAAATAIAGMTLVFLMGMFCLAKDPVVKASGPAALAITAAGIVLACAAVLCGSMEPSKWMCLAEAWLLPVGCAVVNGMMVSKTFRILRIFDNPRAEVFRMTNADVFGYMLAILSPNVLVLLVWSLYDPPVPAVAWNRARVDGDGAGNYIYCSSRGAAAQRGFVLVLYIYNALVLAVLAVLAWLTRKVDALYSESKYIGYFVAVTITVAAVIIPILYVLPTDLVTAYLFKSIAILVVAAVASVSLLGVKFYTIFRTRRHVLLATVTTKSVASASAPFLTNTPLLAAGTGRRGSKVVTFGKDLHAVYMQVLAGGNASKTMVAECVCPVRRFGTVFWKARVAVLHPETRMLYIIAPEAERRDVPEIPQTRMFPLVKFYIAEGLAVAAAGGLAGEPATRQTGSLGRTSNQGVRSRMSTMSRGNPEVVSVEEGAASRRSSFMAPVETDAATPPPPPLPGPGDSVGPMLTLVSHDTGHSVTLQFESAQVRGEWFERLWPMADMRPPSSKKGATVVARVPNIVKTARVEGS